jgi:hypothetical protein
LKAIYSKNEWRRSLRVTAWHKLLGFLSELRQADRSGRPRLLFVDRIMPAPQQAALL